MTIESTGSSEDGMVGVRPATIGDRDLIVLFNQGLAIETEGLALDVPTLQEGVDNLLRDPSLGRYFIAERPKAGEPTGKQGIGQAMVTFEWSDWRNGPIWWIQSVYITRECRRQGVYRILHEHVRREAREAGAAGLRLYVDRDNVAAQATYRSLGMRESRYMMYDELWA